MITSTGRYIFFNQVTESGEYVFAHATETGENRTFEVVDAGFGDGVVVSDSFVLTNNTVVFRRVA